MPLELRAADVQALAPDSASIAAGMKLGSPAPWQKLGYNAQALWGECSGQALYRTCASLLDSATSCSCPSRKSPCKHALGLLFLAAAHPASLPETTAPEWVNDWLAARGAQRTKRSVRAEPSLDTPEAAEQRRKRQEKRQQNVLYGLDQLDAWLSDVLRRGLGRVRSESPSFWDTQARRLVDAQAPALASRVRRIGERVGSANEWSERVLDELGQLALLSHAYRRVALLDAPLAHDVRRLIGHTLDQQEVLEHADLLEDAFSVVAAFTYEDERMRSQRVWLLGSSTGKTAQVLQFAAASAEFAEPLALGTCFRAKVAYWPSAAPQRALIAQRLGPTQGLDAPPEGRSIAENLQLFAARLARLPWIERDLFIVRGAVFGWRRGTPRGFLDVMSDASGAVLPLRASDHDLLLALSGGHPLTVAGEWDGYEFRPLTAFVPGRVVALAGDSE